MKNCSGQIDLEHHIDQISVNQDNQLNLRSIRFLYLLPRLQGTN